MGKWRAGGWRTGSTESMDRQNNRFQTKSYTSWTPEGQKDKRKKKHFQHILVVCYELSNSLCSFFNKCEKWTFGGKKSERGKESIKGACSPSPSRLACLLKDWWVETFMRYGRFIALLEGEGNRHDISQTASVSSNFSLRCLNVCGDAAAS